MVHTAFPLTAMNTAPRRLFIFPAVLLISFFLIFSNGFITAAEAPCSVPKGWENFTTANPMKIGVPGRAAFEQFVKVDWILWNKDPKDKSCCTGFSIDVFKAVVEILKKQHCGFDYYFYPHNSSNYEEFVTWVYNGTWDAVVGDVTILEDRMNKVEFTQPYMASKLVIIIPVKSEGKAWKFLKPFTMDMWVVTGAILIYTMLIVLFLEQESNPTFKGSWKNQLQTSLWFTLSSLFFSHREEIKGNYTRVVLTIWLFVVLVITSSYTASLSSILTVQQFEPKAENIQWLKKNNVSVGCDNASFLMEYLEKHELQNIKRLAKEDDYGKAFKNRSIKAALMELPYGKLLINQHCKRFTFAEGIQERRGGLGFVFPKGSLMAADVSQAILELTENGRIKFLEDKWFKPLKECSNNATTIETESLSLESFLGLFIIFLTTSTICLLLFLFQLLKNRRGPRETDGASS